MIKIGIVSDSHGREIQLERFRDLCIREKFDAVFHLGDVREDAKWLARNLTMPLISVAGNCDPFSRQPEEARAAYEGHHILAVHGHNQGVKYGLERLSYYAEEIGAEIALFGHTHRQFAGYVGRVLLVNPGSLRNGDYATLTLDGRQVLAREWNLNEIKKD